MDAVYVHYIIGEQFNKAIIEVDRLLHAPNLVQNNVDFSNGLILIIMEQPVVVIAEVVVVKGLLL